MALQKFENNSKTTLSNAIDDTQTIINFPASESSKLPFVQSPDYATITVTDGVNIEIMTITDNVGFSGEITVTRGAEGTVASSFPSGADVYSAITAAIMIDFQDKIEANKADIASLQGSSSAIGENTSLGDMVDGNEVVDVPVATSFGIYRIDDQTSGGTGRVNFITSGTSQADSKQILIVSQNGFGALGGVNVNGTGASLKVGSSSSYNTLITFTSTSTGYLCSTDVLQ